MSECPREGSLRPAAVVSPIETRRPGFGSLWLVALLGWTIFICFYDLGGGARFEPIDCWVAQTAREMQQANDWLVPRFSGEVRMQKSPGPYWAVMLTSMIRGVPVDEISARIPNGIAAVVLVITIFWLTRRIAGETAAVFAGFAAASSVLIMWWSHRGASDLGLTTCVTVSLAALWVAAEDEAPGPKRNALFLLGYFAAGLGMLYKMPMPLVVVGLPAFLYVLIFKRWRVFINRWHLVGLVLFFLPWLPWAVGVMMVEDTALYKWKVEFFDRFTGELPNVEGQGGLKNILFYLPVPILYCLPWSLSLPSALARVFRDRSANARGRWFMFIWFASLLVFFTASTGKEYRYFLPALPPLFVLLGMELAAFFAVTRRQTPTLERAGLLAVWILVPAVLLGGGTFGLHYWWEKRGGLELPGLDWFGMWRPFMVASVIVTLGFGLAAWLYVQRREHWAFGTMVGTMWAMWLWAWPQFMPLMMSQSPFIDFAAQLRDPAKVPPAMYDHIMQVGSQDSRIIWYSDLRFPRVIDQLKLLEEERERYANGEQEALRDLPYEIRRYGEEIIRQSEQDRPALFVAALFDYVAYRRVAPKELAEAGRPMPPVYLWFQTQLGDIGRHYVLFGNVPPPYPEPKLQVPAEALKKDWARELGLGTPDEAASDAE